MAHCPLKMSNSRNADAFSWGCVGEKCAWWDGTNCAVLMIAVKINDLSHDLSVNLQNFNANIQKWR